MDRVSEFIGTSKNVTVSATDAKNNIQMDGSIGGDLTITIAKNIVSQLSQIYIGGSSGASVAGNVVIKNNNHSMDLVCGVDEADPMSVGGSTTITSGSDFDSGSVYAFTALIGKNFSITGGSGFDDIVYGDLRVNGNATFSMGDGGQAKPSGDLLVGSVGGKLTMTYGTGSDDLTFDGTVGGAFSLTAGAGNDMVMLNPTSTFGLLLVNMGLGDDQVTARGLLVYGKSSFFMRGGSDTFIMQGNSHYYGKVTINMDGAGTDNDSLLFAPGEYEQIRMLKGLLVVGSGTGNDRLEGGYNNGYVLVYNNVTVPASFKFSNHFLTL